MGLARNDVVAFEWASVAGGNEPRAWPKHAECALVQRAATLPHLFAHPILSTAREREHIGLRFPPKETLTCEGCTQPQRYGRRLPSSHRPASRLHLLVQAASRRRACRKGKTRPERTTANSKVRRQRTRKLSRHLPIGDEDIYTQAPNPEAGHEEEVIPPTPPALDEESHVKPR
jgi:hypothetical protein